MVVLTFQILKLLDFEQMLAWSWTRDVARSRYHTDDRNLYHQLCHNYSGYALCEATWFKRKKLSTC